MLLIIIVSFFKQVIGPNMLVYLKWYLKINYILKMDTSLKSEDIKSTTKNK